MSISKKFGMIIVLALQLPVLITCARESVPVSSVIEVNLKGGGRCLNEFGAEMRRYFHGRMSEADVAGFWDCSIQAVYDFQRLTASENGGNEYTPQALRRFLYRHFLESRMVSDGVLASAMEIKRVLLSGSTRAVTRDEFLRLISLLTEIKHAFLDLRPHIKVLMNSSAEPTDAEMDQAMKSVDRVAVRLAGWLDRFREPYTFQQLETLFQALKEWMNEGGESPEWIEKVQSALGAVRPAKRLVLGGQDGRIEGEEWAPLVSSLSGLLRAYALGQATFNRDLNSGLVRQTLPWAVEIFASVVEASALRRGPTGIPLAEWDDFFQSLDHGGLLSDPFNAAAVKPAFRFLVARALGGGNGTTLKVGHARLLAQKAHLWRVLLRRADGDLGAEFPEWEKFLSVLNSAPAFAWDSEGRLIHSPRGPAVWTPESMRRMVWPFAILNWLRGAYVGNSDYLSEADLTRAVHEILPLLQNFGWLTETPLTVGKRLFREADLFTLASNGDFRLDLNEAVRYLVFVASAFRTSEIWFQEADQKCVDREADCVRRVATDARSRALEAYPELRRQVLGASPENFVSYMRQAEETVLKAPVSGPMGMKDLLQVQMLFQYVETFLRDYDTNRDERIDLPESLVAYQIYGPTLAKLLSGSGLPPDDVLAFFTFMMKYGDTPFAMFGGQVYFMHWRLHRNDWAFLADRRVLMSILNQLSKL